MTDRDSIDRARDTVLHSHPDLDTIVTMSGVMIPEDLRDPSHFGAAEKTIDTNLLGTIRVIDAFTPHLIARGNGTGIEVVELVPPGRRHHTGAGTAQPPRARTDRLRHRGDGAAPGQSPHEILVKGVLMHRWAERDGTYADLVAQRSQALAVLPSRQ